MKRKRKPFTEQQTMKQQKSTYTSLYIYFHLNLVWPTSDELTVIFLEPHLFSMFPLNCLMPCELVQWVIMATSNWKKDWFHTTVLRLSTILGAIITCAQDNSMSLVSRFIWSSHAPPRVKFFTWLTSHDRLQSRANLHKKKIVPDATCEVCSRCDETASHILFHCEFVGLSGMLLVSMWAPPPAAPTSTSSSALHLSAVTPSPLILPFVAGIFGKGVTTLYSGVNPPPLLPPFVPV